jgi:hypothetical protein
LLRRVSSEELTRVLVQPKWGRRRRNCAGAIISMFVDAV